MHFFYFTHLPLRFNQLKKEVGVPLAARTLARVGLTPGFAIRSALRDGAQNLEPLHRYAPACGDPPYPSRKTEKNVKLPALDKEGIKGWFENKQEREFTTPTPPKIGGE